MCFSCGSNYSNWGITDRPEVIHRSLSSQCPHLNGRDDRNVPVSSAAGNNIPENVFGLVGVYAGIQDQSISSSTTQTPFDGPTTRRSPAEEAVLTLDPGSMVHPQYRDRGKRLDSFIHWNPVLQQTPDILASAGFFYAGYADCVRCFYCGVGLRTWEPGDDPWVEHVRWRSSCGYIRRVKGEQFIISVLAGARNHEHLSAGMSSSSSPTPMATGSSHQPLEAMTQENLTTTGSDVVSRAVEMGYSEEAVRGAIAQLGLSHDAEEHPSLTLAMLVEQLVSVTQEDDTESAACQAASGSSGANANTNSLQQEEHSDPEHTNCPPTSLQSQTQTKSAFSISSEQRQQLSEENQQLREESTCKICFDNPSCIVFLPCGHFVSCAECAPALQKCPVCRAFIRGTVRTYTGVARK